MDNFNIWADQPTGCDELEVQFFNYSTGVQEGTSTCFWDFGDETFSTEPSPSHHYAAPGKYDVRVRITDENNCTKEEVYPQMITINPTPTLSIGADTTYCGNEAIEIFGPEGFSSYLWMPNGETSQNISSYPTGEVILRVEDELGCPAYDTINLVSKPYPLFELGPDTTFCAGGEAVFSVPNNQGNALWSTGETTNSIVIKENASISVKVTNNQNCSATDSAQVNVIEYPTLAKIVKDTLGCIGDDEHINLESDADHYRWTTGATTQDLIVTQSGEYAVFAYNELNSVECGLSDSIQIEFQPYAILESPDTFKFCFEFRDELLINTPTMANYYEWEGQERSINSNEILVQDGGIYQVAVFDYPNCKLTQEVVVLDICPIRLYVPSAFTPNGKGPNELFYPVAPNHEILSFRVFNRWGELLYEGHSFHDGWDGTYKGNPVEQGVYVWQCEAQGYDEQFYQKTIHQNGTVTLIR